MESLSVVPVGLTKYREGLAPLKLFGKEDAKKVLKQFINGRIIFVKIMEQPLFMPVTSGLSLPGRNSQMRLTMKGMDSLKMVWE